MSPSQVTESRAQRLAGAATDSSSRTDGWVVLVYRVPSTPPRLRAAVWRQLKRLGAIYLQNATVALPAGPASERAFRRLRHEILKMSGTAFVMSCQVLAGEPELHDAFVAARNDEYEQIVDASGTFVSGVEEEIDAQRLTLEYLQEKELALRKMQKWLADVRGRDVFDAPGHDPAIRALARCDAVVEQYAELMYAADAPASSTS
jgi:hypothetical protein